MTKPDHIESVTHKTQSCHMIGSNIAGKGNASLPRSDRTVPMPRILLFLFCVSLLPLTAQPLPSDKLPSDKLPSDTASLNAGKTLYQFHCAFCHGKGDDGMAANLVNANLVHAPTDSALLAVIRAGIPSGGMPPALGMTDPEMLQLAAYVRSLGRTAPTAVPGDAAAGKALYEGKGRCANCHMVNGEGGRSGPDLTVIGATRSPSNLRTSIVNPNASLVAGWTMVRATLKSGSAVSGIRLNEDNFYLHLRESNGQIRSLAKSDTTRITRDLTKSSMPSYQSVFTPQELDNLVAYLFTLKGKN